MLFKPPYSWRVGLGAALGWRHFSPCFPVLSFLVAAPLIPRSPPFPLPTSPHALSVLLFFILRLWEGDLYLASCLGALLVFPAPFACTDKERFPSSTRNSVWKMEHGLETDGTAPPVPASCNLHTALCIDPGPFVALSFSGTTTLLKEQGLHELKLT